MSDEPLDPATLEALRSALVADSPPEIEPETWGQMLRDAFGAPRGVELHGDLAGADLVPLHWPEAGDVETEESSGATNPGAEDGHDDVVDGGDGWSQLHPGDVGGHEHGLDEGGLDHGLDDGADDGGGDLT